MASEITEDPQTEVDESTEQAGRSRGPFLSSKRVRVLGLLALVMGVEAAGFYLLVPQGAGNSNGENGEEVEDDVETAEVTVLTNIRTTNNTASPGVIIDVTCTIIAEVPSNQAVNFDLAVKKDKNGLIKREVQTIIRGSNTEEIEDASLAVISRKIKEAINKALRKSYVSRILLINWTARPQ